MSEFERFDAIVRKVFSVPHDEIVKREKEYKRKRAAKKARATKRNRKNAESGLLASTILAYALARHMGLRPAVVGSPNDFRNSSIGCLGISQDVLVNHGAHRR
jgi:hypothetical protein